MSGKQPIAVLLVEDSAEYVELVECWLSSAGSSSFILNWTDSLESGLKRLECGGIDVILLDLGLPDSSGYETFAAIRAAATKIPIILLSGADSEALALRMIQDGAQDYLIKTTCSGEALCRAIRYALVRADLTLRTPVENQPVPAQVIGVIGAKGGVGTTSIACAMALELKSVTGERTILMDLDLDGGLAGFLLNVEEKYSVQDGLSHLYHLDLTIWESMVAKTIEDVHVGLSPGFHGRNEVDTGQLQGLLTFVRNAYRWIVLDLGRLNGTSFKLLDQEDEIFLVSSPGVASLFEVKRTVAALKEAGFDAGKLRLLMNHVGENTRIGAAELKRLFEFPVYGEFSSVPKEFMDDYGQFRLPAPGSRFRREAEDIARRVAGRPAVEKRSGILDLSSFARRFRRESAVAPSEAVNATPGPITK